MLIVLLSCPKASAEASNKANSVHDSSGHADNVRTMKKLVVLGTTLIPKSLARIAVQLKMVIWRKLNFWTVRDCNFADHQGIFSFLLSSFSKFHDNLNDNLIIFSL